MGDSNPKVFEYFPQEREEHSSSRIVLIAPIVVALVLACFERRWVIPGAVVAAMAALLYARAERKRPAATLMISGSHLVVNGPRGRELLNIALDELESVELNLRTIEPVFQERTAASRAGPYRVGAARDTFRIEFVTAEGAVPLTEYHTSTLDAEHWLSKMRIFLSSNGWTPPDKKGT